MTTAKTEQDKASQMTPSVHAAAVASRLTGISHPVVMGAPSYAKDPEQGDDDLPATLLQINISAASAAGRGRNQHQQQMSFYIHSST